MKVELVSKQWHKFGGKIRKKGERYFATHAEARALLALGRAEKFEPKPEAPAKGKPETQAGKRRNVTAPVPAPAPVPTPAPAPAPKSTAVPAMSTLTHEALTPFAPVPEMPAPVPAPVPAPAPIPVPKFLKEEVELPDDKKVREQFRRTTTGVPASSIEAVASRETLTRPKAKTE